MAAANQLADLSTAPRFSRLPQAPVLLACPDARPPAYQAAVGFAQAGLLDRFLTGFYYRASALSGFGRTIMPTQFARWERALRRRHDPEIPVARVRSWPAYDVSLRLENSLAARRPALARQLARARTRAFDRALARLVERRRPGLLFAFSDVASEETLPRCRALGIPTVLSMVHGDVREERAVIARESEHIAEFERHYLGDGLLDRGLLAWLHARRLRDIEQADLVLVPSEHIAGELVRHGLPRARIRVVPYAADVRRFRPDPSKRPDSTCTFLFAGGVSLRKGVHHLLDAWRLVRRPGWRLQLLGAVPREAGPLAAGLSGEGVELLGRVSHAEVPARMAAADVFVFPSLFEGSAVVTYEALACGLPSVVTPAAGSVVREGIEGYLVASGHVESLAARLIRLGSDPDLRASLSIAARARAEAFDWPRYHAAVADAVREFTAA
jgi:alpha-maltose-1-phosphate synthase